MTQPWNRPEREITPEFALSRRAGESFLGETVHLRAADTGYRRSRQFPKVFLVSCVTPSGDGSRLHGLRAGIHGFCFRHSARYVIIGTHALELPVQHSSGGQAMRIQFEKIVTDSTTRIPISAAAMLSFVGGKTITGSIQAEGEEETTFFGFSLSDRLRLLS